MSIQGSDTQSSSSGSSMPALVMEGSTRKEKEARLHFPCKVYDMLEDADQQGHKDIVSWNASGTGFTVHNKDLFTKKIIPQYFNQTKYKSFQRQLSLYGFQRITGGENKGLRYHEKLRRGMRDLCRSMKPIGYKPRSSEAKEVMKALASPSPLRVTDDKIPAVISASSLPETDGIDKAALIQTLHAPVEFTADGFPEMGCFEGKTFYLMDSRSFAHLAKPATSTPSTASVAHARPIHNADTRSVMIDGQMKRAWEIGFEMAMAMKTAQMSNSTPEHGGIEVSTQQPLYVE
ncbi:MAG: hypothetical protein SGBAC_005525 [Bacillariaceae sp.]